MLIKTTLDGFRLKKRTVSVVIVDNNEDISLLAYK